MAYVLNGMLIINKKEQPTDTCNSMDETQKKKAKLHESTKKGNLEKAN